MDHPPKAIRKIGKVLILATIMVINRLKLHKLYTIAIHHTYTPCIFRAVSNDSDEKLEAMNIKINKMLGIMEEQRKKLNSTYSIESLHSKVDKVVRLLSDVTEIQKKNSRVLQHHQKNNEAQALKEHEEIEKVGV